MYPLSLHPPFSLSLPSSLLICLSVIQGMSCAVKPQASYADLTQIKVFYYLFKCRVFIFMCKICHIHVCAMCWSKKEGYACRLNNGGWKLFALCHGISTFYLFLPNSCKDDIYSAIIGSPSFWDNFNHILSNIMHTVCINLSMLPEIICGALLRYPYKVGDHKSPTSKKNTWKAKLDHTAFF